MIDVEKNLYLKEGDKKQLEVEVYPTDASNKEVSYVSSDNNIVKVNDNGELIAVKEGIATITVKAKDESGITSTCIVEVSKPQNLEDDDTNTSEKDDTNVSEEDDTNIPEKDNTDTSEKDDTNTSKEDDINISEDFTGLKSVNGKWMYYENGKMNEQKYGFIEHEGGKFLVANGKVAQLSGLVQDPNKETDWYYLAAGQAQTQYTGLAEYDGEWFYVENGKLDTTVGGYIEYDGGLFYVAAGQIKREVNGLAQDPYTGLWYYLANGQVQLQYTGLAEYDWTWFYIIDGALAKDFVGNVEYNGSMFYVENGQLINSNGKF